MAVTTWEPVEPNIRKCAYCLEAYVSVKGLKPRSKRYPLDANLDDLRIWIATARKELNAERRAFGIIPTPAASVAAANRDTLEAGIARLIPQIQGRTQWKADRSHAMAWTGVVLEDLDPRPLGEWDRKAITQEIANRVIALWKTKPGPRAIRKIRVAASSRPAVAVAARVVRGKTIQKAYTRPEGTLASYIRSAPATSGAVVSDRTIRHRCRMLKEVWKSLDGVEAPTPVDHANVPPPPKSHPVAIPIDVLVAVLAKLRAIDSLTFVRYWVFATTMQRPVQIGLAQPGDVKYDDDPATWVVRSAKNEPAHTIPLEADAVAAWRAFDEAGAWGSFDTGKYGKRIHEAGLPKSLRPYQGRHTGAFALIAAGVPLDRIQGLLGHTSPLTTRNFYAPIMADSHQRTAAKAIDGRFARLVGPVAVNK